MNYRITFLEDDLAHESLAGEVVIVHLKSGRYYSLNESASHIWDTLFEEGYSSSQMEAALRGRFSDPEGLIASQLEQFLQALAQEELIALTPHESPAEPLATAPQGSLPWEPPALSKHVDMEGMLLLDPIHEVSEQGWPEKKAGDS